MIENGFGYRSRPVLRPLENVECRDAVLDLGVPDVPKPSEWPEAEFIIGNPPFLGSKLLRAELGDAYIDLLFEAWDDLVSREADFVCYWHEKARQLIHGGKTARVGLLATNSIRGGANRQTLDRIKQSGDLFVAWSDEPWVVEGAAVRVSIIGQDGGVETNRYLDGDNVGVIHSDLTGGSTNTIDITKAAALPENLGAAFMGDTKVGPFDISGELAREWLRRPGNPNGRPNSDVVVPWVNALDVTRRPRHMWIVDFPPGTSEHVAAQYESPFEYIREKVRPYRSVARSGDRTGVSWWIHQRPRPAMRASLKPLKRFIVTPCVSKHRLFVWQEHPTLPDHALIAIARDDDTTFGILHSRFHEAWSLRLGTSLEDRPRYTPTTTFQTFPFPEGLTPDVPARDYANDPRAMAIAEAARRLVELRNRWLNPPEWVEWVDEPVSGYPKRPVALDEAAARELKKRTLTNLYNERPQWLANAHADLDSAVAAAYDWPEDIRDDDFLRHLLSLNLERAGTDGKS